MRNTICLLFTCTVLISICAAQTNDEVNFNDEFDGITIIDISTVSGNCTVLKHDEQTVKIFLTYKYKPIKNFEPLVWKEKNKLIIKEKMHGSNSGNSEWTLMVPKNTDIKIKSASGNIQLEKIAGKIQVNTASGNIEGLNITTLEGSELISASGNIHASEITILGNSKFTSASGNVNIILNESPQFNLLVSSASGNSTLNYNHYTIRGHLEMKARTSKGKTICPIGIDDKSEVVVNNQKYIVKSVTLENSSPTIEIHTASGIAELKL